MIFLFAMLLIPLLFGLLDKARKKVQPEERKEKVKHPAEFDLRWE